MPNNTARKTRTSSMPTWFHQKPSAQERQQFKDATVQFILYKKLRDKLPKPGVNTYRDIMRWVRATDDKWYDVNKDNFSPTLYPAHQSLADTIRNLLLSQRELTVLLDEAEEKEREMKEPENTASQIEDAPDDQQDQPFNVDNILRQDQVNTAVPPLPGSSEQHSTKATPAGPAVGQKRAKPDHFAEREEFAKKVETGDMDALWYVYLARKAEAIQAERAKVEAKLAWSAACMKHYDTPKKN